MIDEGDIAFNNLGIGGLTADTDVQDEIFLSDDDYEGGPAELEILTEQHVCHIIYMYTLYAYVHDPCTY